MKSLAREQMRCRRIAIGIVALICMLSFFLRFTPAGSAPAPVDQGSALPE
jgi:hypothetical protein